MSTDIVIDHKGRTPKQKGIESGKVQRAVSGFYPVANGIGNYRYVLLDNNGPTVYTVPNETLQTVKKRLQAEGFTVTETPIKPFKKPARQGLMVKF